MQISKTTSIRLANILGLDFNNQQDQVGILDALSTVSDPELFIEWIRNNRDTVDFINRRERLTILHSKYKNTKDGIPIGVLEKFCKELSHKFKIAIATLRDNEEYLTDDLGKLNADGVQYFLNKEIELMDSVGTLNRLITLYELGTLYETLYAAAVKKTLIANKAKLVTAGEKRVLDMVRQ